MEGGPGKFWKSANSCIKVFLKDLEEQPHGKVQQLKHISNGHNGFRKKFLRPGKIVEICFFFKGKNPADKLTSPNLIGFQGAAEFCPHHVGHYLGMDTHDTHMVSRSLGLHPGMVITVEPGIYISQSNEKVPERFVVSVLFCMRGVE